MRKGGLVLVGGVVVLNLLVFSAWTTNRLPWQGHHESRLCSALKAYPGDVTWLSHSNGPGVERAEWSTDWWSALTFDPYYLEPKDAPRFRSAILADDDGFEAVVKAAPPELEPALIRLRKLAANPSRARKLEHTKRVQDDVDAVGYLGHTCTGLV